MVHGRVDSGAPALPVRGTGGNLAGHLARPYRRYLRGSSIAMVNDEAIASCAASASKLEEIIARATVALCGRGSLPISFNAAPHGRDGVAALSAGATVVVV